MQNKLLALLKYELLRNILAYFTEEHISKIYIDFQVLIANIYEMYYCSLEGGRGQSEQQSEISDDFSGFIKNLITRYLTCQENIRINAIMKIAASNRHPLIVSITADRNSQKYQSPYYFQLLLNCLWGIFIYRSRKLLLVVFRLRHSDCLDF